MIYLVCGPIGAGKTSFAHKLAERNNAVRFSEDEWLSRLFVPDAPEELLEQPIENVASWASGKYRRCRGQIWKVCEQLLKNNISIVLDGTAANMEQRDVIREKAKKAGVGFQLFYIYASRGTRWARVFERNNIQGLTYSLKVTPAMFEMTEAFFEPPVGGELAEAITINSEEQPRKIDKETGRDSVI